MIILTQFFLKQELKPLLRYLGLQDVTLGCKKVIQGLSIPIKSAQIHRDYSFYKVRIGSSVHARMIVFLVGHNKKIVPLMIRLKKDKKIGMNMSVQNVHFLSQLQKNLDRVISDVEQGAYKELDISS